MKKKIICIFILQYYLLINFNVWSLAIDGRKTFNETVNYIQVGEYGQKRLKLDEKKEIYSLENLVESTKMIKKFEDMPFEMLNKIINYLSLPKEILNLARTNNKKLLLYDTFKPFFNVLKYSHEIEIKKKNNQITSYDEQNRLNNLEIIFDKLLSKVPNILIIVKDFDKNYKITNDFFKKNILTNKSIYENYFENNEKKYNPIWLNQIIDIINMENRFLNYFQFIFERNKINNSKNFALFLKHGLFFYQSQIEQMQDFFNQNLKYGDYLDQIETLNNTYDFIEKLKEIIKNPFEINSLNKYFEPKNNLKIYSNCIFKFNNKYYTILNFVIAMYMGFGQNLKNYRENLLPLIENIFKYKYYEKIQKKALKNSVLGDNHITDINDKNTTIYIMPLIYMIFKHGLSTKDGEKLTPILTYLIDEISPENYSVFYNFIDYYLEEEEAYNLEKFISFLIKNNRNNLLNYLLKSIYKKNNFLEQALEKHNYALVFSLLNYEDNTNQKFFRKINATILENFSKLYHRFFTTQDEAFLINKLFKKEYITKEQYNNYFLFKLFNSDYNNFSFIKNLLSFDNALIYLEKIKEDISISDEFIYKINAGLSIELCNITNILMEKNKISKKQYIELMAICSFSSIKNCKKNQFENTTKKLLNSMFNKEIISQNKQKFIKIIIEKFINMNLKHQEECDNGIKKILNLGRYNNFFKFIILLDGMEYFENFSKQTKKEIFYNILKLYLDFDEKFYSKCEDEDEKTSSGEKRLKDILDINNSFNKIINRILNYEGNIFNIKISGYNKTLSEMIYDKSIYKNIEKVSNDLFDQFTANNTSNNDVEMDDDEMNIDTYSNNFYNMIDNMIKNNNYDKNIIFSYLISNVNFEDFINELELNEKEFSYNKELKILLEHLKFLKNNHYIIEDKIINKDYQEKTKELIQEFYNKYCEKSA